MFVPHDKSAERAAGCRWWWSCVRCTGILACLDGYMNIAMEQTEEYKNGVLTNKYGDCFIRGNNGMPHRPGVRVCPSSLRGSPRPHLRRTDRGSLSERRSGMAPMFAGGRGAGMHWKGGEVTPPPKPPGRPAYARPLSPWRQVPASMAFVTDSNRPQPLWQSPPTACLTASGTTSEVPSLPMHPWGRGFRVGLISGGGKNLGKYQIRSRQRNNERKAEGWLSALRGVLPRGGGVNGGPVCLWSA